MHRAARVRHQPVNAPVQPPCGRIRRVRAFECVRIIGVNHDQITGLDPAEMHLVGVHQEPCAIVIDRETKVICHAFVHIQPRRPAECGGHIHPLWPVGHVLCVPVHHRSLVLSEVQAIDGATLSSKEVR